MSERASLALTLRRTLAFAAGLAACGGVAVGTAAAQRATPTGTAASATAAELRALADSVEAMRARAAEARRALDAAVARAREVPDDSLSLSGATVLLSGADVPARERARLATAFARVASQLQRQLGEAGPSLLAETRWRIRVHTRRGIIAAPAVVFASELHRGLAGAPVLTFPIDVDYAAELIRRGVGEQLVRRHPALDAWLGGSFWLTEATTSYYFAARDLALHGGTRARSCARGTIDDCGRVLDPARFGDWRAPGEDSRRAPTTPTVRSSLLQYAIELRGGALLGTLAAAPDSAAPIALLATAVGQTPDALLAGWQQRVMEGGRVRSRVAPRLLLSSAAWIVLCGIIATRRRPA